MNADVLLPKLCGQRGKNASDSLRATTSHQADCGLGPKILALHPTGRLKGKSVARRGKTRTRDTDLLACRNAKAANEAAWADCSLHTRA